MLPYLLEINVFVFWQWRTRDFIQLVCTSFQFHRNSKLFCPCPFLANTITLDSVEFLLKLKL